MRRSAQRHYTEEELLLHSLEDEAAEMAEQVSAHLQRCSECSAVVREFASLRRSLLAWQVEDVPEQNWQESSERLLQSFRADRRPVALRGWPRRWRETFSLVWEYALENPLPAVGYIAAALAFASERTITIFRLDRLLPQTNEVMELLKQAL